tara:strand:- start:294 stop:401 length:108 start_codon:yes stop_codon:yes gene_type:complete
MEVIVLIFILLIANTDGPKVSYSEAVAMLEQELKN